MPAFRARTVAAASAVLLLAACSSSGSASPGVSVSASGDLATQASAYAALPPEEQEAQLRTLSTDVEHQLMTLTGLEKELGGAAKATAAYDAVAGALVARATKFRATSYVGKFGARAPADDTPTLGGMIFASWMLAALAPDSIVSATNDAKPGETYPPDVKNDTQGVNKSSLTREGSIDSASLDWSMETSANGVTGKLRVTMKINPCPDPTGKFTATATLTASATSAGGRVGSNTTIDISVTGQVDDDAKLTGWDVTTATQAADFGNGKNSWGEVTDKVSWAGDKVVGFDRKLGRTAGKVPDDFAKSEATLGLMVQTMVTDRVLTAAQKGWESGRCVALVPTLSPDKRSGLEPSTTVTITAPPRSKIDGAPTGGTVTATLTGDTSVDPAGSKVKADATFTYVAPGEKDKSASVALEARSKRGVAKASVDFDTKPGSYKITGSIPTAPGGTTVSGTICKPDKPFTMTTSGDMIGTAAFTPSSATGGRVRFTGKVGNAPFVWDGSGTYTIDAPKGSGDGTLAVAWTTTIHIPVVGNQTKKSTESFTLTPISSC